MRSARIAVPMLVGLAVAVTVSVAQFSADLPRFPGGAKPVAGFVDAQAQAPSGPELRQALRDVVGEVVARIMH